MLRTADLLASLKTLSRRFAGRVSPGGGRQLPRWLGPSSGGSFPHWLIMASPGRSGVTASPPFIARSSKASGRTHTAVAPMADDGSMAAAGTREAPRTTTLEAAVARLRDGVRAMSGWIREADGQELGEGLIQIRESGIDSLEAVFADGLRRFDESGEYAAEGALSVIAWLKWRCKLSSGAAAERVGIARQLEQLPRTEEAFARGSVGYQHVAMIARTAEHLGAGAVRKAEASLLQAAKTHDPGQF